MSTYFRHGHTAIIELQIIDYNSSGYQIRPHPADNEARIYFDNPSNASFTISLINEAGALVHRQTTSTSFFDLSLDGMPSGWYAFRIIGTAQDPELVGKLLVQH